MSKASSDERDIDETQPCVEEVFDEEFEEFESISPEDLEWEDGGETVASEGNSDDATDSSSEPLDQSRTVAYPEVSGEALSQIENRRREVREVAESDLPACEIANELLTMLRQQNQSA